MALAFSCSEDNLAALTAAGLTSDQASAICGILSSTAAYGDPNDLNGGGVISIAAGIDSAWLVLCGALVFVMHGGFAMLCAGAIRSKNTLNILLQTILDACVSAIAFYCVGYAFAYGEGVKPNRFIGNAMFGLSGYATHYTGSGLGKWTDFFYQWAFAATATTIPAGCVAERFNFNAYLAYTLFVSAFVYPVVVHWVWSREGWLSYAAVQWTDPDQVPENYKGLGSGPNGYLFGSGMIDFAGSGVVHMVGGLTGLMGAWLVGPRLGRFDSAGNPVDMPGHSATLVVLGTVLLWFGWYGFNPGSTLVISNYTSGIVAGRAAVTTTLCGAAGGLTCLLNGFRRQKAWDLVCLCNGCLVGFVAITANAHVVEPWAAIINGFCAGLIFDGVCWIFLKLRIDDPLSAAPMHGFGGMWGVFFTGLLAKEDYVFQAYARNPFWGVFYGSKGNMLASQCIGILAIVAWVCGLTGMLFFGLKMVGWLRISEEDEHRGLDASKHGGSAYNQHAAAENGNRTQGHTPQIKA